MPLRRSPAAQELLVPLEIAEGGQGHPSNGGVDWLQQWCNHTMDAPVRHAPGDARRLNLKPLLQHIHVPRVPVSRDVVMEVLERSLPAYDKAGEQHYNLTSIRPCEVPLRWRALLLARMLAGGEDPIYIGRPPRAQRDRGLAEATIYLAIAPRVARSEVVRGNGRRVEWWEKLKNAQT